MAARLALILSLLAAPLFAGGFDHSLLDKVLRERVSDNGEVDYAGLAADRIDLDAYLERLGAVSPDSEPAAFPDEADRLAYWINAYNALTLQGVLDNYPLGSIRNVPKFFDKKVYSVGGRLLSLDDVEHRILRKRFAEPRIHFAIVCASVSCPALWNRAYRGDQLDGQLAARARRFVNDPRNLVVDVVAGRASLSKIFDWFQGDFVQAVSGVKGPKALLSFALRYAEPALKTDLERLLSAPRAPMVRYFDYDWGLNARPGASGGAAPQR